jgi:hypothetical protein
MSKYPQYRTIFRNYSPFYVFTIGRKKQGCIPAGITVKSGRKEYTTAQLLETIFNFWQQHEMLPPTLLEMKEPPDWWTANTGRFNKSKFIKLCEETAKQR